MENFIIRNIGSEKAGTAGATAKLDFTGVTGYDPSFKRQGVAIASTGAAAINVKVTGVGASTPTVSGTDFHYQVPAGQTLTIRAARSVAVYLQGSTSYTAVELG